MKKKTKAIAGITAVVIAGAGIAAGCIAYIGHRIALIPESFTVTAHTGCEGTRDNSLEAITKGAAAGADIVEFDINFTERGEPVLAHDKAEKTSVTLEEAFNLVAEYEKLKVNVDCKTTENLKAITQTAEKCGVSDRIFYTGIEAKDVEAVKRDTPEVTFYLNKSIDKSKKNNEAYIRELIAEVKGYGAQGLNIHFSTASRKMTDLFHSEGLEMSVWTVNEKKDMYTALLLGCDNITTRQPTTLIEIIKNGKN